MSGETIITVTGNITADPELRFISSGDAVASFSVASAPRKFNAQTKNWEDGDALFMRVNVWRQLAENVAESLTKGNRVTVTGELKQRSYETKEGEHRVSYEITAYDVSASMLFATVKINRANRGSAKSSRQTAIEDFDDDQDTNDVQEERQTSRRRRAS